MARIKHWICSIILVPLSECFLACCVFKILSVHLLAYINFHAYIFNCASEVTTLWRYINHFIIIIIVYSCCFMRNKKDENDDIVPNKFTF